MYLIGTVFPFLEQWIACIGIISFLFSLIFKVNSITKLKKIVSRSRKAYTMFKGNLTHQYHIKVRNQSIGYVGFLTEQMGDILRSYEKHNQNAKLLYFVQYPKNTIVQWYKHYCIL